MINTLGFFDGIFKHAIENSILIMDIDGKILETQPEVTDYILNEAKLAMVPFSSFGAKADSAWYRISVGCVKKEEINEMLEKLKKALEKAKV